MSEDTKKSSTASEKEIYRVSNWPSYNTSLKNRGNITFWMREDLGSAWYYSGRQKAGGEKVYSDVAVEFCLTIKYLFGLGYRQMQGFIEGLFDLSGLKLSVMSYTQVQRRSKTVEVDIRVRDRNRGPITVVIDSTGLKVYGEGEWKVRKHGWNKYRTWRKLHMGSNGATLEILSVELSSNQLDDAEAGQVVVKQLAPYQVEAVAGDGAYDKRTFRGCLPREVKQLIPPRRDAAHSKGKTEQYHQRDPAVERIKEIGREQWKKEIGYHIRNKSEVNMFRYKMAFGERMNARKFPYEQKEVLIKSKILNQFLELGMPKSYKVMPSI